MMIEIIWDEPFLRILKKWRKKHPDLSERFQQKISLFIEEPFHPSLRTHSLSGNLDGCLALSITYEYRLVFKFISDDWAVPTLRERVLLLDIGSHDDVY